MPLFQRTIKLTLATCLAAALAYALGLTYAISAGVIAILSISDTRRSTIKQAYQRFMSTLLALAIGVSPFLYWGSTLWALGVFIALYAPFYWAGRSASLKIRCWSPHLLIEQSHWDYCSMNLPSFNRNQLCLTSQSLYAPLRRRSIALS